MILEYHLDLWTWLNLVMVADAYAHRRLGSVPFPVGDRMPAEWEPAPDRELGALSDPRLSSPARMRKKCCYGQKNLGSICSSMSPSPTHLSHTKNITLSRIKCERYIFIKKCVRSFIEVRQYVWLCSAYICIMYAAIQHYFHIGIVKVFIFIICYYLEYSDCWPHLCCYTHNVSTDKSFGLLQVFHVSFESLQRILNWTLYLNQWCWLFHFC